MHKRLPLTIALALTACSSHSDKTSSSMDGPDGGSGGASPGHPTADGRSFADLGAADHLGDVAIVDAELVDYTHAFTYDILPASSSGTYFAGGVPIGSTLF